MSENGGYRPGVSGEEDAVSAVDAAAYILEMTAALVVAAREAGLSELADTLARAQNQSAEIVERHKRGKLAPN